MKGAPEGSGCESQRCVIEVERTIHEVARAVAQESRNGMKSANHVQMFGEKSRAELLAPWQRKPMEVKVLENCGVAKSTNFAYATVRRRSAADAQCHDDALDETPIGF